MARCVLIPNKPVVKSFDVFLRLLRVEGSVCRLSRSELITHRISSAARSSRIRPSCTLVQVLDKIPELRIADLGDGASRRLRRFRSLGNPLRRSSRCLHVPGTWGSDLGGDGASGSLDPFVCKAFVTGFDLVLDSLRREFGCRGPSAWP